MTDYTQFKDADLVHELGDDAEKWAIAFLQHNPEVKIDPDIMRGWFANAIEHSHDIRTGRIHNGDHMQYLIDKGKDQTKQPAT